MKSEASTLYLDLMKKSLSYSLWPDPPVPVKHLVTYKAAPFRWLSSAFDRVLGPKQLVLCREQHNKPERRDEGRFFPLCSHTMLGRKRLDNLQYCVETVLEEGVEGDLIETGVWRGGASIFMRAILKVHGVSDRKVFVADSFAGLPEPNPTAYPADKTDRHHEFTFLAVPQEEVENNFRLYDLLDGQVVFLKGWFKDTLPMAPIEKLAVMRLDGDMYESTMDGLNNLYPKLTPGGFCIIDDYGLPGCRRAVDDFRAQHGISAEQKVVDWTGVFWRKV